METLPEKTFPKIVAALPARHAAPLSVANFDDSWLPSPSCIVHHMLTGGERLLAPQIGFGCFGGGGWVAGGAHRM